MGIHRIFRWINLAHLIQLRPLEYRSVIRTQSNTGNDEKRSGGTTGTTTFDHTPQQRTESWGTKN